MKRNKAPIRAFFEHYSDEGLAALLAHAQSGKLSYGSCCCFVGSATAPHALCGALQKGEYTFEGVEHLTAARQLAGAQRAEAAFYQLGTDRDDDTTRRRILIPMIKAEMKRREKLSKEIEFQQAMRTLQEETCLVA